METVYSDTLSSSTESCEGVFHLGNNILVVRVGSDSGDDIISISDDENNPVSDQNVSSTVPNTGTRVGDNISVPEGSEDIITNSGVEGSEPLIPKDSSLETEEKSTTLPKLENNHQESFDEPPKIEKVSEEVSEGMIEEILPIPPEYRLPDEEIAGMPFVAQGSSDNVPSRPQNPNPDQLHAKNLRAAFNEFKEKYPMTIPDPSKSSAKLVRGRAFSISEVTRLNNKALKSYWRVVPGVVPIPSGFWEEMARLDATLDAHYESMDSFLPNEDWICRRMDEGNTPWLILRRYFIILLSFYF